MATYTVTSDSDAQVSSTVPLTKTIDGVEWNLSVNIAYDTSSWAGILSTEEVDAINDANDAWDTSVADNGEGPREPDDVASDLTQSDFPTGFVPASYPSLEATMGEVLRWNLASGLGGPNATSETLDAETMSALRSAYESLGLAGLENAGWVAEDEEIVVNGTVTLELLD